MDLWAITAVAVADTHEAKDRFKGLHFPNSHYTGLKYGEVTRVGQWQDGSDVNKDIGGSTTGIYIQYSKITLPSSKKVLTDIQVTDWGNWNSYDNQMSCENRGQGWQRAIGTSRNKRGALTTGTDSACAYNGLCVKFEPLDETHTYISHLTLTFSGNSGTKPETFDHIPPKRAGVDIHKHCGDGKWAYLWYYERHMFESAAVITDVQVTDNSDTQDSLKARGYTGVRWNEVTLPNRTPVNGNDVNSGIGGSRTRILVKYENLTFDSDTRVLTGIQVTDWKGSWTGPNPCPAPGWETARGTSRGFPGALTTATEGPCLHNGLCVKWEPLSKAAIFVSHLALTKNSQPPTKVIPHGRGPQKAGINIHFRCPDGDEVYLWWYGEYRTKEEPPKINHSTFPSEQRLPLLQAYAPRVRLAEGENFKPASVEWATEAPDNPLERYETQTQEGTIYNLRVRCETDRESLCNDPEIILSFFYGQSPSNKNVPMYGFWVSDEDKKYCDLVYFFWYPYNRGKKVLNTTYGNHVGDWEHIILRMAWAYGTENQWDLNLESVYLSAHDFAIAYHADSMSYVNNTHVKVYAAKGSHGLWKGPGDHRYKKVPYVPFEYYLVDKCPDGGTNWDGWKTGMLEGYDYTRKVKLIPGGETGPEGWPDWMKEGYISRWGDPAQGEPQFGQYKLGPGPTGPIDKKVWDLKP